MANNRIQVKRTNVSGRTANVTNSGNTQYIAAGEFALNMADSILYSSNGSALIEVGSNNTTLRLTNALIMNNDKRINFNTVNTSVSAYFVQQNDDNFVFYTTNTAYGQRPVWSIFANSITSAFDIAVPLKINSSLTANGTTGTAGQFLTSNGTATYWSTVSGGSGTVTSVGSGNGLTGGPITGSGSLSVLANTGIISNTTGTFVNASYIATITANNATFINGNNVLTVMESLRANRSLHGGGTITVDGSGNVLWGSRYIVISNGRGTHFSTDGYFDINCPTTGTITGVGGATNKTATAAGIPLAAWEALYYIMPIGSASGSVAANFRVVSYTSDVEIPSNWLLICAQNGDSSNYYFNNGVILKAGQSFAGATFTSANMPLANNATNLGGVAAASYVQNTDSRTLSGNLVISGTSFTPSSNTILLGNSTQRWVLSANTGSFSGAVSGITTLATGNTTITGFANVTTTIQGGSSLTIAGALSGVTTSAMGNTTITGFVNATSSVNAASYTVGTAFTANSTVVNAVSYYAGTLLVANSTVSNATHLGGVAAASYVQNTDSRVLSGNLNFTGTNNFFSTGLFVGANVIANTTALFVGNSTANSTTNATAVTAHIQHASRPTLGFNYTIANTVNSLIVGPYQVNTGFTLTVETGARLVIA